jgi:hypothetical protein
VVADRAVERVGQITAAHLDVQARHAAGDGFGSDRGDQGPVGIHEGEPPGVHVRLAQLRVEPHALDDLAGGAADVDGVAAAADRGGLLDDGDLEAVAVEPVGQGRAGDARAGDEDLAVRGVVRGVVHGGSPSRGIPKMRTLGILFSGAR